MKNNFQAENIEKVIQKIILSQSEPCYSFCVFFKELPTFHSNLSYLFGATPMILSTIPILFTL